MTTTPDNIPADVLHAAEVALRAMQAEATTNEAVWIESYAKAILAERERCVAEMNNFIDHVTISVDGRSRFDIYDLNRECKKSVRYVRDRVSGTFDEFWSEEPLPAAPKTEGA